MPTSNARVTQAGLLAIAQSVSNVRITQSGLLVIAPVTVFNPSATSRIVMTATAADTDFTPSGPQNRSVSASSTYILTPHSAESHAGIQLVSASSTYILTPHAPPPPASRSVSAASHYVMAARSSQIHTGIQLVSAASTYVLTPKPLAIGSKYVSATSSYVASVSATKADAAPATVHLVSALSTMWQFSVAPKPATSPLYGSASSSMVLSATTGFPTTTNTWKNVSATSRVVMSSVGTPYWARLLPVSATTPVILKGTSGLHLNHTIQVSGQSWLDMHVAIAQTMSHVVSANSGIILRATPSAGRDIHVSAVSGMGFSCGGVDTDGDHDAANLFYIDQFASATRVPAAPANPSGVGSVVMHTRADAEVQLAGGAIVPGGDTQQGLRTVLFQGVSAFPLSFAESSDGVLVASNGIDPMVRWDGMAPTASTAGVVAPWSPVGIYPVGVGQITGSRFAYQRFINIFGLYSDPSPINPVVECGSSGIIAIATYDATGYVTVTSPGHGLTSGQQVIIAGVQGLAINGTFSVLALSADTFKILGLSLGSGAVTAPGYWTSGAASVRYAAETPTDPSVCRRQILRNLDGDTSCWYVDIDTTDLTSTSFTSAMLDEQLSAQEPMVMDYDDGMPAARRYGYPPSHKAVLASHLGRIFASVDQPYDVGDAQVSLGSPVVQGVGTAWTASMAGRSFYAAGATKPQAISSVMPGPQLLILEAGYSGPSNRFAAYSIRPANSERRLVYYSEPNEPESWPAWNAFAVPESGDEITGLAVMKSFLYVICQRNFFSFTFKSDPGRDGFIFPRANRGCINNRCWVIVESKLYALDEAGIHTFDGDDSVGISSKIHNLFNDPTYPYQVDWSADKTLWHCTADPVNEIIRWFVDFVNQENMSSAICYDYRRDRWWLEQYPEGIYSSTLSTIGYRRVIAGTTGRRVIVLGEDVLDGIASSAPGVLSGTVLSATSTSLSIATVSPGFPNGLAGVPVSITSGVGRGQQGIICDSTTSVLTLYQPLAIVPAAGDTFQIGGIQWEWRGGWLPYVDDESDNARDVGVVFKPTSGPGAISFQLYFDYGDLPQNWGQTKSIDGISTIAGSPYVDINTQVVRGYAIQRMQSRRERYSMSNYFVSLCLGGVQSSQATRIFEAIMDGCERGGGDG